MKKKDYAKLKPHEQAAVHELIRDTPTALHTKARDRKKGHTDLSLVQPTAHQTALNLGDDAGQREVNRISVCSMPFKANSDKTR
ncbi:hypothetical protein [Dyadobacter sp. BHUBP1]|uniref:hypothetical protein n=1 Tax=Dyadobacter sp. BHUBP1 TaxID=3424178 RepID=UPI003D34C7FF